MELLEAFEGMKQGSQGTIVLIQDKNALEQTYCIEFHDIRSDIELRNVPQSKLKVIQVPE